MLRRWLLVSLLLVGCRGTSFSLNCLDNDETEVCEKKGTANETCKCVKKGEPPPEEKQSPPVVPSTQR